MAFEPGNVCCSNAACALVKIAGDWEKLPHQTEVSFTSTASTTGVVTSDTGGREAKACGTVATTGTIGLGCHDGDQARFEINTRYRIRFAKDCGTVWTPGDSSASDFYGVPIGSPTGDYWDGIVLITSEPVSLNISASDTPITVYAWELDGAWIAEPATIVPDIT